MVEDFWTVREFIEMLKEFPPDTPMILSPDDEGNGLRMVNGAGIRYVTELRYRDMDSIDDTELGEYDTWVMTTEVW